MSAFDSQVGGSHYKQYAIQPYEFFFKNKIPHHKAAIIRRIMRYDHPTGKGLEDLQKIKHEIDLIIELESEGEPAKPETENDFRTPDAKHIADEMKAFAFGGLVDKPAPKVTFAENHQDADGAGIIKCTPESCANLCGKSS